LLASAPGGDHKLRTLSRALNSASQRLMVVLDLYIQQDKFHAQFAVDVPTRN